MSKEYSKETQQKKKLQHYDDKVSKPAPQDNIKNIKSKEKANNKISIINQDRSKIKEKIPMDSKKKVTRKNAKPCNVKDVEKIGEEEMNFENRNVDNEANPSEDKMNQSSNERDQINLYNDLSGTRKDINIGGFDKEKSSEKSSIFTNGDFKINTNNNDIRKTTNNKNKGNLIIERGINNFDNINNTGLEIYDHNKSVDINMEEIKNINSQSSIYNINNNNDDKNKNINNNNNIKHLKNELLETAKTNANKNRINNINKNVINNINRNNNLNNNIINEIDNNIAGYSHNEFNILIKNIENTNQINCNLATKISDLVKKIDESNTNTKDLVKKIDESNTNTKDLVKAIDESNTNTKDLVKAIDESNTNTKDLVKTIDESNTNVAALVKQNQTIIDALIHGNSKSLNPNENTGVKNHS